MIKHKNIHDISVLNNITAFDVCIIGSGPAGITIAKTLVENEIHTIILESGSTMFQWLFDRKLRKLADYDFSGNTDYPLTKTKARLIGGNSNFWTGRCERFSPSDFEQHPYTPPHNPWPISYKDIEPYYEKAENLLRVRGDYPSHYAPPRKAPYPLPFKPDVSYLKSLMRRADVVADDSPTATPKKAMRFFKFQKEVLYTFLSSRFLTFVQGATVIRLIANSRREITAAEVGNLGGDNKVVRAKLFIITCGGIETPRLLLLSKSEIFPNGIGNAYDRVGRGFNEHPGVNYYGRIPHEWGTIKPTNKIVRVRQFYDTYRAEGLGSIFPVVRQSWILPHHTSSLKMKNLSRNVASFMSRFTKATLFMGATIEQEILDSNRVTLSKETKDFFGNPIAHLNFNFSENDLQLLDHCRELILGIYKKVGATNVIEADITFSRHHQGTCRMGNSPLTSVVDKNLRVHESPNLYICGSEVFVTGGAMQPLLSITAFAYRLSEHIVDIIRNR